MSQDFDIQYFRNRLLSIYPNASESYIEDASQRMLKNHVWDIDGDDVVFFQFFDSLLDEDDINYLDNQMRLASLRLRPYDASGQAIASLSDFLLDFQLVLDRDVLVNIIGGVGANLAWNSIKTAILFLKRKIGGKYLTFLSAGRIYKKKIRFGVMVDFGRGSSVKFLINDRVGDQESLAALEQAFSIAKKCEGMNFSDEIFFRYSKKEQRWIGTTLSQYLKRERRKIEKREKKGKED